MEHKVSVKSFVRLGVVAFIALLLLPSYGKEPVGYGKKTACAKQLTLWSKIVATEHQQAKRPDLATMHLGKLLAMGGQMMTKKVDRFSDFAPRGWVKYLHRRGAIAKVKFVPEASSPFTGIFKSGAECALLRLSLTYKPGKRAVAPGLALKVLRDQHSSANLSALYTLEGQEQNYNFFANPLSNIVPIGDDLGLRLTHEIFSTVSDYPEELLATDLATMNAHGVKAKDIVAPRQLFFKPVDGIHFSEKPHDFRDDLAALKKGQAIYEVYAAHSQYRAYNYSKNYKQELIQPFLNQSQKIGTIVLTSRFIASEFGDTGILFRHEVRPKKQDN